MLWLGDYVILSDANMQRKIWGQSKNQRKILRKMKLSTFEMKLFISDYGENFNESFAWSFEEAEKGWLLGILPRCMS